MDLSQPGLLSSEELISIIEQRLIKVENLRDRNKDELLEIFKKYIMPKPRRQTNRNKNQDNNSNIKEPMEVDEVRRQVRIETPAIGLETQMKRIKLNRPQHNIDADDSVSRKRIHHENDLTTNNPNENGKRQKITYP